MTTTSPSLIPDQKKVGMVSLGCPKALVDSERILTRLRAEQLRLRAAALPAVPGRGRVPAAEGAAHLKPPGDRLRRVRRGLHGRQGLRGRHVGRVSL